MSCKADETSGVCETVVCVSSSTSHLFTCLRRGGLPPCQVVLPRRVSLGIDISEESTVLNCFDQSKSLLVSVIVLMHLNLSSLFLLLHWTDIAPLSSFFKGRYIDVLCE